MASDAKKFDAKKFLKKNERRIAEEKRKEKRKEKLEKNLTENVQYASDMIAKNDLKGLEQFLRKRVMRMTDLQYLLYEASSRKTANPDALEILLKYINPYSFTKPEKSVIDNHIKFENKDYTNIVDYIIEEHMFDPDNKLIHVVLKSEHNYTCYIAMKSSCDEYDCIYNKNAQNLEYIKFVIKKLSLSNESP